MTNALGTDATVAPVDAADKPDAIRFAVVGVDHPHAVVLTAGLLEAGATCIGWSDPSGEGGELFGALFPGLPRLEPATDGRARPDLVVVASIPNLRAGHAIEALRAGADVLVAKPAATTVDQIHEIEGTTAETGGRWWVAFTEQLTSRAVRRADGIIATGRIGTVRHVLGLGPHRRGTERPPWFTDPDQSGPMLADLASHQIHHAARLLGTTGLRVRSARTTPSADGSHPEIIGEVLLEGGTGSAYIRVDWLTPDGLASWGDVRLMVTGDRGTIEVRANCDPGGAEGADHLIVVDSQGTERIDTSADALTWASTWLDDVRAGSESLITTAHSLAITRLALDAAAAARQ